MSLPKRQAFDKIMRELEAQGIVEDSHASKYCSPALIVIQKGKPRFVVDLRKINSMTQQDTYPLPRQKDIFPRLQKAEFLSLFDLKKAFFQFPIAEEDRDLTTFVTKHAGAKRLTRSLMGYVNSPAHCQRIIDKIIKPYRWTAIVVYIDDAIVFSQSWDEHVRHIAWLMTELHKVGLTLDPGKAFIGFKSISLLGHLVNKFGLAMQPAKVEAMMKLERPRTVRQAMQILGFFGYYREFVRNYAQIVKPITDLLSQKPDNVNSGQKSSSTAAESRKAQIQAKMDSSIHWSTEADLAFCRIKEALRNATYLSHALEGDDVRYVLYTDACKLGFGAALHVVLPPEKTCQEAKSADVDGPAEVGAVAKPCERPVAFISRSLNKAETNYWPTELEMAALVWALRRFQENIEGHPLTIYTDHSALTWLFQASNSKTSNQRLLLWALELEKWKDKTEIIHRAGRTHLNADILSRFPVDVDTPAEMKRDLGPEDCPEMVLSTISTLILSTELERKLVKGYTEDRRWKALYQKLQTDLGNSDDVAYHSYRLYANGQLFFLDPGSGLEKLVLPANCVALLFEKVHDEAGHSGFSKCLDRCSPYHVHQLQEKHCFDDFGLAVAAKGAISRYTAGCCATAA